MTSSSATPGPDPSAPGPSRNTSNTLPAKRGYSFCSNLSITEELVKDFIDNVGVTDFGGIRHDLQLCNHGLVLELWEMLGDKLKDKSKLFKADILGNILFKIFRPNFESCSPKQLLVRVTTALNKRQKTCKVPRKGGGRNPPKRKTLEQFNLENFQFYRIVEVEAIPEEVEGVGLGQNRGEGERVVNLRHERDTLKKKVVSLELKNKGLQKGLIRERQAVAEEREEGDFAKGITSAVNKKNVSLNFKINCIGNKLKTANRKIHNLKRNSRRRHHLIMKLKREKAQLFKTISQLRQVNLQQQGKALEHETHLSQQLSQQTKLNNKLSQDVNMLTKSIRSKNLEIKRMQSEIININHAANLKIRRTVVRQSKLLSKYKTQTSTVTKKLKEKARKAKKLSAQHKFRQAMIKKELPKLKTALLTLENEKAELEEHFEERMQSFLREQEVVTFQGGRYVDEVRALYQDLMGMNVGAGNCENVVRAVLNKLGGIEVGRLPKSTFALSMTLEGRALAQRQVADTMLSNLGESATLCTDGTTKWGHKYGTFDVVVGDGTSLTLGLRDMVSGSADDTLETFKQIVSDVTTISGKGLKSFNTFIANIKNTMSDRHSAEKKSNKMLKSFRDSVLPEVVAEWRTLNEKERENVERMNNFFCGLHFVVGMAKQAAEVLKLFEKDEFGSERFGSAKLSGVFMQGSEAGAVKLVRLVCKSVQERVCEKFGKPIDFLTFLTEKESGKGVDFAPFKGNRFNILFRNAGVLYHLYQELCEFFDRVKDDNRLMKVVWADLGVLTYKAEVRALGLVNKVITKPLWQVLNGKSNAEGGEERVHIFDMNARYQRFVHCMSEWSCDASAIMRGESMFPDVCEKKDDVYETLLAQDGSDSLCKKILELLCAAFAELGKRMLCDHLEGGKFSTMSAEERKETCSVPTTNVVAERDFGMLDRLMRQKPSATTIALEGLIMWRQNHTSEWRDSLTEEERAMYMRMARESVGEQRRVFYERRKAMKEAKLRKWVEKRDKAAERVMHERERVIKLTNDLSVIGGVWKDCHELEERLNALPLKERCNAVRNQLRYWKWVLKANNTGGLLNLSSEGHQKGYDELVSCLKKIISQQQVNLPQASQFEGRMKRTTEDENGVSKGTGSTESLPKRGSVRRNANGDTVGQPPSETHKTLNVAELVGRIIKHCYSVSGENKWFWGVVTKKKDNRVYIQYDGGSDLFYFECQEIEKDFISGDLCEVSDVLDVAVGKEIIQMWLDEETDEEVWWSGCVLSVNKDKDEVVIEYDDQDESGDEDDERVTFSLEEIRRAYKDNELKFVKN